MIFNAENILLIGSILLFVSILAMSAAFSSMQISSPVF